MEATFYYHDQIDEHSWDEFITNSPQGSCYHLYGYLNACAPGWGAVICQRDGAIEAAMPLHPKKKHSFSYSFQPPFSQYWGICFSPPKSGRPATELSRKRKLTQAILAAMPSLSMFSHGFAPEFDYPLPFHWDDYSLNSRITYQLDLAADEETLFKGLDQDARYLIRRTEKEEIKIAKEHDPEHLLALLKPDGKGRKDILTDEERKVLHKILSFAAGKGMLRLYSSFEPAGKCIASGAFLTFKNKTIYLISAVAPGFEKTGVMTSLIWQAIRSAKTESAIFDFEGSMLEPIEAFFRSFSPHPVPYLFITKNKLPLLLRWLKK